MYIPSTHQFVCTTLLTVRLPYSYVLCEEAQPRLVGVETFNRISREEFATTLSSSYLTILTNISGVRNCLFTKKEFSSIHQTRWQCMATHMLFSLVQNLFTNFNVIHC